MKRIKGPGWPDMRGWAAVGYFALAFYVLHMIERNPALLTNASFMQFAGAIVSGGVLLVATFLFGGTKAGTETSAKIADAYANSTPNPTVSPAGGATDTQPEEPAP